jgi:hypothetical protein
MASRAVCRSISTSPAARPSLTILDGLLRLIGRLEGPSGATRDSFAALVVLERAGEAALAVPMGEPSVVHQAG